MQSSETHPRGEAQDSERYKQFIAQFQAQMEQQVANATIKHESPLDECDALVKEEVKEEKEVNAVNEFEFEDALHPDEHLNGMDLSIWVSIAA